MIVLEGTLDSILPVVGGGKKQGGLPGGGDIKAET